METNEMPKGHISDVGMLNLLSAKTAEDFVGIESISDVGVVVVPEHLATALAKIAMHDVGAVVPVPVGDGISFMGGQCVVGGEALAQGNPENLLFVAGQLIITSAVEQVGYKNISVAGQLIAPKGSEGVLTPKLAQVMGQTLYYPMGARLMLGEGEITNEFLELLREPTPLALFGTFTLTEDVDKDMLREKVPEMFVGGTLRVPERLKSLVQFLAVSKFGSIESY